jgi:hypothetical protein
MPMTRRLPPVYGVFRQILIGHAPRFKSAQIATEHAIAGLAIPD